MLSLPLIDLGTTGIFILVTERTEVILLALSGMLLLGLGALMAGWFLYRPIIKFEAQFEAQLERQQNIAVTDSVTAARRIQRLPWLSAISAFGLVLCYCLGAFALGVFTPAEANLDNISTLAVGVAIFWYAAAYAVLYSYFIFFNVNDLTLTMRRHYRRQLEFASRAAAKHRDGILPRVRGGLARKLAVIFLVIGVLPMILIALDLTVFAPIRAAQGLSREQVIALDLIVSMYVVIASIVFVNRSLLAAANELFVAQEAIREGNLSYKAAVLTDDELGEVTGRFNVMVDALRERELMKTTLNRYLSPTVASQLIESGGTLASTSVEATVMFTDIDGFTALAETLTPAETVDLLNHYFALVTHIIVESGGTVNNFIGDAVVAIFNVPDTHATHARAAIESAVAIQRALQREAFTLGSGRTVALPTRIGINTGNVCAGVIGSIERQGYTVYGDAVNLAARIEPLNKQFHTRILAADRTVQLALQQGLNTDFVTCMGEVSVVGRQAPVVVHRIDSASILMV